jgi:hypothetical protein
MFHHDMYLCILDPKKSLIYVPYVTKLIIEADTNYPLVTTSLVIHKTVKTQWKQPKYDDDEDNTGGSHGHQPFAASEEDEGDAALCSGPCGKNARNELVPSSWEEVQVKVKKARFLERTLLCMNIETRKYQYDHYVQQHHINKNKIKLSCAMCSSFYLLKRGPLLLLRLCSLSLRAPCPI